MSKKIIVIGDTNYNSYGLIRSLHRCNADFFFICLGNIEYHPIGYSRYVANSRYFPIQSMDEIWGVLDGLKSLAGEKCIICSHDAGAQWVDANEEILSLDFTTPCRGKKLGRLFDKNAQCELAAKCGLTVPASIVYTIGDQQDFSKLSYPVFIKPMISTEGSKADMAICQNQEELLKALSNSRFTKTFLIQEYIENGFDVNCIGYHSDVECAVPCAVHKLRAWPDYCGAAAYGIVKRPEDFGVDVEAIKRVINESGYYGPFSVDLVHSGGKNYFMELNYRNDGNAFGLTCAGVNLYDAFIKDEKADISKFHSVKMINPAFDFALWRSTHNMSFAKWLYQFLSAKSRLDISFSDPMPVLWRPIGFILRRLKIKQA